jgi:hypothetical protein
MLRNTDGDLRAVLSKNGAKSSRQSIFPNGTLCCTNNAKASLIAHLTSCRPCQL